MSQTTETDASTQLDAGELRDKAKALEPWPTSIYLGQGVWTREGVNMIKTSWYVDTMEDALGGLRDKAILDIGSNTGYVALEAALRGASVYSIEPHDVNYRRCELVYSAYGLLDRSVKLTKEKMEDLRRGTQGVFDGIFFCGTIYHLEKPWEVLNNLADMTDAMLVESRLAAAHEVNFAHDGLPYYEVREVGSDKHPLHRVDTGMIRKPTRRTLIKLLQRAGYTRIEQMMPCAGMTEKYQNEDCVGFIATRHRFEQPLIARPNRYVR